MHELHIFSTAFLFDHSRDTFLNLRELNLQQISSENALRNLLTVTWHWHELWFCYEPALFAQICTTVMIGLERKTTYLLWDPISLSQQKYVKREVGGFSHTVASHEVVKFINFRLFLFSEGGSFVLVLVLILICKVKLSSDWAANTWFVCESLSSFTLHKS